MTELLSNPTPETRTAFSYQYPPISSFRSNNISTMTDRAAPHPMVPVPEAIRQVLRETARVLCTTDAFPEPTRFLSVHNTPWSQLLGQVLAQDVLMSPPGYPPYNASIMDGYALASAQKTDESQTWTYAVADKVFAGATMPPSVDADATLPTAYYITTGAVVPDSCDCVVPIEECEVSPDGRFLRLLPSAKVQPNQWIRPVGCDLPENSQVLLKGHCLDSVSLALLIQSGVSTIVVRRPVRVAVLSTGNELLATTSDASATAPTPQTAMTGLIPDVNRPILLTLLANMGDVNHGWACETMDCGQVRDDNVEAMAQAIDQALETADVLLTTGGISMGETDIVEKVLMEHCGGKLHFGRLHMKPGKPTTFVTIQKNNAIRLVFAMPGNPVSATVCTHLLVKPCLDLLLHGFPPEVSSQGSVTPSNEYLNSLLPSALVHPEVHATLAHDISLDFQRPEYHRVYLSPSDGQQAPYQVSTTGNQRSSRLMSCRGAQALLVLPVGTPSKPKALTGEAYPVLLLSSLRGWNACPLSQSKHLAVGPKRGRDFKVAVVQLVPEHSNQADRVTLSQTCNRVTEALSGSKSGQAILVAETEIIGDLPNLYPNVLAHSKEADVVVVSCVDMPGSLDFQWHVSEILKQNLTKEAKPMAMQARQGAASEDPKAALFEVVVGYAPQEGGSMVVALPASGVSGGLGNIRGLLKHSLNVARGKVHNDHHTHGGHDHGNH
eukprot:Nitzschia sp. Nitz4//scaffold9_size221794//118678//120955//NITZ4_001356-RA/size221794-augustus-gene-0.167-mRNA-1//-1//CDS//3329561031//7693//frame0